MPAEQRHISYVSTVQRLVAWQCRPLITELARLLGQGKEAARERYQKPQEARPSPAESRARQLGTEIGDVILDSPML